MESKIMRKIKCKNCKELFTPFRNNALQKFCLNNDECLKVAKTLALESKWKKEKAKIKNDLLTKSDYLKIAQQVFNAFIRKRDEHLACISCGTFTGKINAGHYRSVGSCPELRFNEFNCHKQCEKCNTYLHSNAINYRIGLIKKIGVEKVEWLESKHEPLKLSIEEIKELIKIYKLKIKNYEK